MCNLILIKHSSPEVVRDRPAKDWVLSEAGGEKCAFLAEALKPYDPELFVGSEEPKAAATAEVTAGLMDVGWETMAGLHEHERAGVGYIPDQAVFHTKVKVFFDRPGELVFGEETAEQALERFQDAVGKVLGSYDGRTVAIATHGTVISLFVSQVSGGDPFALWQRLNLPSFVVLTVPAFEQVALVERVVA
jgi:broad specificity phosphatase PhoE